ncbi:hypothetical protein ACFSNO_17760 [Streptomyces cirratus]
MVLTPDGPLESHAVVVADGSFGAIGPAAELERLHPRLTPVRLPGHALMPGFVDTHHHLTQSFGAALAFGEPSEIFRRCGRPWRARWTRSPRTLRRSWPRWSPCAAGSPPSRTRAPGPPSRPTSSPPPRATPESAAYWDCCATTPPREDSADVMAQAHKHLARYDTDDLIHPSLAVSIPEAATARTLRESACLAAEAGAVVQIHVNEHLVAVERSLVRHGLRPLEHLHHVGALGPPAGGRTRHPPHPGGTHPARRQRRRRQLQPGRQRLEGQRRRPRGAHGGARHPLRARHRRHPR